MRQTTHMLGLLILSCTFFVAGCGDESPKIEVPTFPDAGLQQGRAAWMQVCRNCHLLVDRQSLYENAIRGIRGDSGWRMPPRGGNDPLADVDVQLAVDFMIAAVEKLRR